MARYIFRPRDAVAAALLVGAVIASSELRAQTAGGEPDLVGRGDLSRIVISAIARGRMANPQDSFDRGLIETGLTPNFGPAAQCPGIDETNALDYGGKRGREGARHGGIDIPTPRGTPILAVADGEVVATFMNEGNPQGIEVVLRHRPEETGHPLWIYTQYTHLLELPPLAIGQRVKMGDPIGRTSNTGISGQEAKHGSTQGRSLKVRRDAVHYAVFYSSSPKYARLDTVLVPADGYWMDPNALYRPGPPFDSQSMKALPPDQKRVAIPYMLADGRTVPPGTKLIWPYSCTPR